MHRTRRTCYFPPELYLVFWDELGSPLLGTMHTAIDNGAFNVSFETLEAGSVTDAPHRSSNLPHGSGIIKEDLSGKCQRWRKERYTDSCTSIIPCKFTIILFFLFLFLSFPSHMLILLCNVHHNDKKNSRILPGDLCLC